jgi:hypothetical protein
VAPLTTRFQRVDLRERRIQWYLFCSIQGLLGPVMAIEKICVPSPVCAVTFRSNRSKPLFFRPIILVLASLAKKQAYCTGRAGCSPQFGWASLYSISSTPQRDARYTVTILTCLAYSAYTRYNHVQGSHSKPRRQPSPPDSCSCVVQYPRAGYTSGRCGGAAACAPTTISMRAWPRSCAAPPVYAHWLRHANPLENTCVPESSHRPIAHTHRRHSCCEPACPLRRTPAQAPADSITAQNSSTPSAAASLLPYLRRSCRAQSALACSARSWRPRASVTVTIEKCASLPALPLLRWHLRACFVSVGSGSTPLSR